MQTRLLNRTLSEDKELHFSIRPLYETFPTKTETFVDDMKDDFVHQSNLRKEVLLSVVYKNKREKRGIESSKKIALA